MKALFRAIAIIAAIIGTSTLHIAWVTIFPYPLNLINIATIALVYLLLTRRVTAAIATAFSVGVIIELYAITPFGLLLGAFIVALLAGTFFAMRVLTTNSFWGSVALCLVMVVVNRLTFIALLIIVGLISGAGAQLSVQAVESMVAEGMMTTVAAALLFAALPLPHRVATVRVARPYGIHF
ncbi:MAG: hypothetical protein AAB633_02575 [Patescibacteria group bacterium]